jgi:hypothetical protein
MSVDSLSVEAMKINQTGCVPAMDPTPARVTELTPVTFGKGCGGQPGAAGCGTSSDFCMNLGPRHGFRQCIWKEGKHECPTERPEVYTERFVFYEEYEDTRSCSDCACGVPAGSTCTAQIAVYANSTCSGNPLEEWMHQTSLGDPPVCKNLLLAGTNLGSKEASLPTYTPGTCIPFGGNPIGSIVGSGAVKTACCIPQP